MGLGAGQVVYADDLAGLRPAAYYKGASTTKNNSATLTDDPDLSNIPLDPGYYSISVTLFTTNASALSKLKTRWAFTGSWTSPMRSCHGPGAPAGAASGTPENLTVITNRGYDAATQDALYWFSVSSAYAAIREVADRVEILGAGNLSVQWAQGVATAANTIIQPGSVVRISKVDDL
jgi:hypothetical protein